MKLELEITTGFDPWEPIRESLDLNQAYLEFIKDGEARGLRPATIQTYRGVIGQFVSHVKDEQTLNDLGQDDIL